MTPRMGTDTGMKAGVYWAIDFVEVLTLPLRQLLAWEVDRSQASAS